MTIPRSLSILEHTADGRRGYGEILITGGWELTTRFIRPILKHDGEIEHAGGASKTHP